MMSNDAKSFDILSVWILYNYCNDPTKLFSNVYLIKYILAKSFFPCNVEITFICYTCNGYRKVKVILLAKINQQIWQPMWFAFKISEIYDQKPHFLK